MSQLCIRALHHKTRLLHPRHRMVGREKRTTTARMSSAQIVLKLVWGDSGTVVQKVASSILCRNVLEQDTEFLIAPDVQCAISVNVKCVYIVSRTYVSRFG